METAGTMSAILADLQAIVTSVITSMGSIVTFITANPLVELFVIVSFVGLCVGLLRRVMGL